MSIVSLSIHMLVVAFCATQGCRVWFLCALRTIPLVLLRVYMLMQSLDLSYITVCIPSHSSSLQQMLQGQPSSGAMGTVRQLWSASGEVLLWLFRQMTSGVRCLNRGKGFNMASRLLFLGCWESFEHATVVSSTPKGPPHRTTDPVTAHFIGMKLLWVQPQRQEEGRQVEVRHLKDRMNEVTAKRERQK